MKILIKAKHLLAASLLATAALSANAAKVEETVVHQIPAASIQMLDLSNVNGSIQCVGKDTDTIELVCLLKASAGSKETAQKYLDLIEIDIAENGNELIVKTKLPKSKGSFFKWITRSNVNASVSYTIEVPKSLAVDLDSVNGGITVSSIAGDVELETVNGGIKASDISGPVDAGTVNGGIKCMFAEDFKMTDMTFGTVNGGINVKLPSDAAFDVHVSTVNGGIHTDFELPSDAVKKRRKLHGSINGGGPILRLETVNGGVSVNQI